MHLSIEKSSRETETKLTNFWLQKKRFLAKYFHFKTCHVILRSLSCMYTASCTRNLQTDKILRELERLKILLSFYTRCCTIFWRGKSQKQFCSIFCQKCCQGKLCAKWFKFSRQKSWYIYEKFFWTLFNRKSVN